MPYADPEKLKAYSRTYHSRPEYKEQRKAYHRTWWDKNSKNPKRLEQMKRSALKRQYGITPEQQEQMRLDQGNKCAICSNEFTKSPHTDHDHETGKVRSLLCGTCNKGLGQFKDDPELLRKAAVYIERNK
jgi:hypothetical protein